MTLQKGSLIAIVGVVGSGKSSLLSAILGEMEKFSGKVNTIGKVAYVSQQAWIQQETLKQNVLFHSDYKHRLYHTVIEDCALLPDLHILPAGDQTEIGEKGINLSGGQKLRVSLARAAFEEADIYILDDPLSSVDAHVGKQIFQRVIGPSGMLQNKTRVMVTHGISWLPYVDRIIVLNDGRITDTGSYRELINKNGMFSEFLNNYIMEMTKHDTTEADFSLKENALHQEILSQLSLGNAGLKSLSSISVSDCCTRCGAPHLVKDCLVENSELRCDKPKSRLSVSNHSINCNVSIPANPNRLHKESSLTQSQLLYTSQLSLVPDDTASPLYEAGLDEGLYEDEDDHRDLKEEKLTSSLGRLVDEEKAQTGNVEFSVYKTYLQAVGLPVIMLVVLLAASHVAFSISANVWLSQWSDDAITIKNRTIHINDDYPQDQNNNRLIVYAVLGIMQGVMACVQEFTGLLAGVSTSRVQHERLLKNILACPMAFFDQTPTGRILNRFGKDVDVLDQVLPKLFLPLMRWIFYLLGSLIIVNMITPWSLVAWVVMSAFYIIIQRMYVASTRQLNRLISINRSPIYAHFGETLTGVSTIRAFKKEDIFITESMSRIDTLNMSFYPLIMNNRCVGVILESMGAIIILIAATYAVTGRGSLTPGTVGLAVTYALTITGQFNWIVRYAGQVETQIVSVERIKEFTEVPTETDHITAETHPHTDEGQVHPHIRWPDEGHVHFDNYSLRYRQHLDLVLKNINFHISPGEKVGLVGRTGAGKSSLTMGLFRIIEAAHGSIFIDGINIASVDLHHLRSKLTIIPQDPVLFSGSLRMNLDPFDAHSDDEIWTALKHAHLHDYIYKLPDQLLYDCAEGGENLSVGQRQLICLARALLRKTKILILDEATAAVDLETDELIQTTIKEEFANCTVLTIAHRLNTILDCQKVLVLDAGQIKEVGSPQILIEDHNSTFYKMAKDAGIV